MDKYHVAIVSTASFFAAILFFAVYNQWVVFRSPWSRSSELVSSAIIRKKSVILHYFHKDKWKSEKQEMLWQESTEKNIFHLVNAWLVLLDEEHISAKKTMLQSVVIAPSGTAYLSFDRNILSKEETVFKKWMLIEGLLKTITSNDISITHIQFLVQHQLLQDIHIDFSLAWPVHGFI